MDGKSFQEEGEAIDNEENNKNEDNKYMTVDEDKHNISTL